jgi:hypothetical protein
LWKENADFELGKTKLVQMERGHVEEYGKTQKMAKRASDDTQKMAKRAADEFFDDPSVEPNNMKEIVWKSPQAVYGISREIKVKFVRTTSDKSAISTLSFSNCC